MSTPRRDTETRLRQHLVGVRLSPTEYEAVMAAAKRDGCSPAQVLRDSFLYPDALRATAAKETED